jgi:Tol biopolymer transport system component
MEPRFTPDGQHVLTTHDVGGGVQEIFSISVGSGAASQLTNAPEIPFKWRPSLDAGGTTLIITYGLDYPTAHIGRATLGRGLITDFTPLTPVDTSRPSYDGELSPDGALLVFDAGGGIWIANADGSGAHAIASGKLGRFDRQNAGQVLFTHEVGPADTHTQLWEANVDGSNARMVVDGNFAESFSVVSPR